MSTSPALEAGGSAHLRSGIRRVFESSWAYAAFQSFVQPPAAKRAFVEEFIRAQAGARILDIGCGTGSILDHLPPSVEYVGYDLNPNYIASAQARYHGRGRFFCADINANSAPTIDGQSFDLVLALGLLHHLTDPEARRVCESAHAHLRPDGVFVTFDGVYVRGQNPVARYLLSRDRGQAVRTPEGYLSLVEPVFARVDHQIRTDLLRIPYTHFIMHCHRH